MTAITNVNPHAFLIVPADTFDDLHVGEVFWAPGCTLTEAMSRPSRHGSMTITRCTTTPSGRASPDAAVDEKVTAVVDKPGRR